MFTNKKNSGNIGGKILATGFFLFTFLPMVALLAQSNTSTGGTVSGITYDCAQTQVINADGSIMMQSGNCTFADLIAAVQNIVKYATGIALSFSVVVIAIAGWTYLTSGGDVAKRKKANEMFEKVAIGIGWVLAAWLVITMIMNALTTGTGIKPILK
jgi:hypothetical protein